MSEGFGRRAWAVLFTGIPFSVFKIGGGIAAWDDVARPVGLAIVAWGAVDALLNLLSLVWPHQLAYCLTAAIGRLADRGSGAERREQVGLALDTLLSFLIVASMIWFGRTSSLPRSVAVAWELAVIASILGVGIQRLWDTVRAQRAARVDVRAPR